ncbi:MAG: hypothetical protein EOO01_34835 [Chitinophagaceae bacterium]|nr:MAG: hypothetical protein EOO01_34835 [Chitinophagaceae bacterium]
MNIRIIFQGVALSLLVGGPVAAQMQATVEPYQPSKEEVAERYRKAALMDSVARNKVYKFSLQANWQADGESFWYRNMLKDSAVAFVYVDVLKNKKQLAFDHHKLAEALTRATGKEQSPAKLAISNLSFEKKASVITATRCSIPKPWDSPNKQKARRVFFVLFGGN